jgi:hypothetical protein
MRLEAGLLDISRRLKIVGQREGSLSDPKLLKRCHSLFESASKAKQERRFYVAWDCLQQIERELLATLVEEEELGARWIGLLEEANQKLRRWRKTSVDKIGKSTPPAPKVEVIRAVMEHLHAQSQNQFHKQDLLARYVTALLIAAVSVITVILGFAGIGSFDWLQSATDPKGPSVFHLLGAGVLLGLMGSVLSVAFVAVHRDLTEDVPTFLGPFVVTSLRVALGGAVALPIVFFGLAGLLSLGGQRNAIILALCFIGGFSERWFIDKIRMLEGA